MIKFHSILPVLGLALACLLSAGSAQARADLSGHWEGRLDRGTTGIPVRLDVGADGATLDLPDLVYAQEPVSFSIVGEGATLTLPFGLGEWAMTLQDGRLVGRRGRLSLVLERRPDVARTRETLALRNGAVALPAILYAPTDLETARGAVVVVGGSGQAGGDHWSNRSWCDLMVRQGLVCLVYGRRAERDAQGRATTLAEDAEDLAAVTEDLARRPGVDASRLGVLAGSRGVWIAAEAARLTPRIRFMILRGVPATTPSEQEMISLDHRLRSAGRPADQIADALAYDRLYFSVARTGRGWRTLAEAVEAAQHSPWGEFVDQPRTLADLDWWKANGDYDPRPAYAALDVPILALWGGDDAVTPSDPHAALLRQRLTRAGDVEFVILPGGDHRGETPLLMKPDGTLQWFGMAPGYLETLVRWMAAHGLSSPLAIPANAPSTPSP